MDTIEIQGEITVVCVTATSFPVGIQQAFHQLEHLVPPSQRTGTYGISWKTADGSITYKAAASTGEATAEASAPETFTIRAGRYRRIQVINFMQHPSRIGEAFTELLRDPGIDRSGYCLEVYKGNDVDCLVPLGS